jgi:hypothetical protein
MRFCQVINLKLKINYYRRHVIEKVPNFLRGFNLKALQK